MLRLGRRRRPRSGWKLSDNRVLLIHSRLYDLGLEMGTQFSNSEKDVGELIRKDDGDTGLKNKEEVGNEFAGEFV